MVSRFDVLLVVAIVAMTPMAPWCEPRGEAEDPTEGLPGTRDEDLTALDLQRLITGQSSFIDNLGQIGDLDIDLYSNGDPLSVAFTRGRIIFAYRSLEPASPTDGSRPSSSPSHSFEFSMRLEGACEVEPVGVGPIARTSSFFLGEDPNGWVRSAGHYQEVLYQGIYDGVDLRFRFHDGMLKYDVIVGAFVDPDVISVRYEGLDGIDVDPITGDLLLRSGPVTLRDSRPIVLQDGLGVDGQALAGFRKRDERSISFIIPSSCTPEKALVIDPGIRFSTFFGGSFNESLNNVEVDTEGNLYLSGYSYSPDFPWTNGSYGTNKTDSVSEDLIVVKFNPTLSTVLFSTHLGGDDDVWAYDIELGKNGEIICAGASDPGAPITDDAIDKTCDGVCDGYLLVLSNDGSDLLYGSYFGGDGKDELCVILKNDDTGLLLYGRTNSSDLPTTPGAFCETYVRSHPYEEHYLDSMFIVKLNKDLPGVVFCSYINGFRRCTLETYLGTACTDHLGNIYVAGGTDIPDFPVTPGAYDSTLDGEADGFIMKLDSICSNLQACTLLGGSQLDLVSGIEVNSTGSILITGVTMSPRFPTTGNALQKSSKAAGSGYFTIMMGNLSALEYSTYFGGSEYTHCNVLRISQDEERVFILGGTSADDLPTTPGCFNPAYMGNGDFHLTAFNLTTFKLDYCTYLGGSNTEQLSLRGMTLDGRGNVIICGGTPSCNFPVKRDAYDTSFRGPKQAFIVIFHPEALDVPSAPGTVSLAPSNNLVNLSWDPPGIIEGQIIGHRIYRGPSETDLSPIKRVGIDVTRYTDRTAVNGRTYFYSVSAINSAGEGPLSVPQMVMPFSRPSQPRYLNATTGDWTIVLTWSPPADDGGFEILGYHVLRGEVDEELEPLETVGNVTVFIDDGVERGVEYNYTVIAFSAAGNSTAATILRAHAEGPPDPPRSLSLVAGDRRVDISWKAPLDDGGRAIEGYRILRGTDPDDLQLLVEVGPLVTEHLDSGLENGVTYHYCVVAFNVHGPGPPCPARSAKPVGLPGPPRDLVATPDNGSVTLTWSPPLLTGGSPITVYRIYVGTLDTSLSLFAEVGNVTTFRHRGLTNGVTVVYAVSAKNERGEGEKSTSQEATPLGVPGPPTGLNVAHTVDGVLLSWSLPVNKGGAKTLTYRILRGTSQDALEPLDEVQGVGTYLDTRVSARGVYHYAVQAVNALGMTSALTPVATITAKLAPDPPTVQAVRGDGSVLLTWSPPEDDGGSPVTGYIVYHGPSEAELVERARLGPVLVHTDRFLENGRRYFFVVVAVNEVGPGARSAVVNATPIAAPGQPQALTVRYTDRGVELEWLPPERGERAAITGYRVYRRVAGSGMVLLVELGPVLNHTDSTALRGRTYYFSVAAISEVGEGQRATEVEVSTGVPTTWWWLLLVLALLGAVATGVVVVRRRKTTLAREAAEAAAAAPAPPSNIIEEVYLVYGDGRLIASCSREECATQDADLTSSMLIAIQGMVQDGLERGGELESIKSGENILMMERGVHVNLAAVLYGRPDDELREELESKVAQIEGTYAGLIEDWTGDRSVFEGVDGILEGLLETTSHLTREDLERAMARYQVSLLSAVDLYRGYVRLKVAAMNATPGSVTDAAIEVRYDPGMLRLIRVEPDTLEVRGDTAVLGNVKAGEKRTVSFLFDPLICQETYLDGTVSYRDAKGDLMHTSMKRRHASVVCPIFFTREHANTAMLRRLVAEELEERDARLFRFPAALDPGEALRAGKQVMGGTDVQLVREYAVEGPPYEAEVWYYGETKVKGYRIVMRLRVLEEERVLEFFAASSAMEPIAGLLAEFRRDLLEVLRERHRVEDLEELTRDEGARLALEGRELLIDAEAPVEDGG